MLNNIKLWLVCSSSPALEVVFGDAAFVVATDIGTFEAAVDEQT